MANCQNMRYTRRPMTSAPSSCTCRLDGCPDTHDFLPSDIPLALAYVQWPNLQDIYEPCKALKRGTLFQELDKPFLGKGGCRR